MDKVILSPEEKIIRHKKQSKENTDILKDGLMICLDKLSKMRSREETSNYLLYGNEDSIDIKEEIARLLIIATTMSKDISPIIDIENILMDSDISKINSMFIREYFNIALKNKTNSFMRSNFYKQISKRVDTMEFKRLLNGEIDLSDIIVLNKNIKRLYVSTLDQNIEHRQLDVRKREPLIDLFQYILDLTLNKFRNGVTNNV